ncbi:MAG: hypothetical protein L7V85_07070 [Bacteroidia bacterium]|nr:hypothetical protein [Bacteroidia bacterium]
MLTTRELFIVNIFNELHDELADTCESMLSDEKEEAKTSLRNLFVKVERLKTLTTEDDES